MIGRHDVAIVGAGPVGLVLACLLARRGADVVVLERRERPSDRTRAVGIHPPGFDVLVEAGVGEAVRRETAAIRTGTALCRGEVLGGVDFARPVLALAQQRTEALLRERLGALRRDALRTGVEVQGVERRENGVVLRTAAGVVEAGVVVGADGVRGVVRGAAGIGWRTSRGTAPSFVMADSIDTTGRHDTAALHLEPGGVVESFPLAGGLRRWVVRVRALQDPPLTRAGFAALVRERIGADVPQEGMSEPSAFTARQGVAEEFAATRTVLVGDAAHEISPIGGQGMNLGWLDAAALARALTPEGSTAAYAEVRRRAALRAMRRARFNMLMGAPYAGAGMHLRNAAVRALTVGPLRARMSGVFAMRGL